MKKLFFKCEACSKSCELVISSEIEGVAPVWCPITGTVTGNWHKGRKEE